MDGLSIVADAWMRRASSASRAVRELTERAWRSSVSQSKRQKGDVRRYSKLLIERGEDFAFTHNEQFLAFDDDFDAGVAGKENPLAFMHLMGDEFAAW